MRIGRCIKIGWDLRQKARDRWSSTKVEQKTQTVTPALQTEKDWNLQTILVTSSCALYTLETAVFWSHVYRVITWDFQSKSTTNYYFLCNDCGGNPAFWDDDSTRPVDFHCQGLKSRRMNELVGDCTAIMETDKMKNVEAVIKKWEAKACPSFGGNYAASNTGSLQAPQRQPSKYRPKKRKAKVDSHWKHRLNARAKWRNS